MPIQPKTGQFCKKKSEIEIWPNFELCTMPGIVERPSAAAARVSAGGLGAGLGRPICWKPRCSIEHETNFQMKVSTFHLSRTSHVFNIIALSVVHSSGHAVLFFLQ